MKYRFVILIFLLPTLAWAQNALPQIENLSATYDQGLKRITLNFDLLDTDNDSLEVTLKLSNDEGATFRVDVSGATGDIGYPVSTGLNKQIIWESASPIPSIIYRAKLIVDDGYKMDVQEIVDQVDSARIWDDMIFLAQERHFLMQPQYNNSVKDTIESSFAGLSLETRRQEGLYQGYQFHNIIGRHEGETDAQTTYIIDAHFDAINGVPGADDNASGVAGVLEAARVLSKYNFKRSINFIGFDLEEEGGEGSAAYVNLGGIRPFEQVAGVLNLEMIGYYDNSPNSQTFPMGFNLLYPTQYGAVQADSFRGNFLTNVAGTNDNALKQKFDSCALKYVPELKVISLNSPSNPLLAPDFWRSDHARFWLAGIPALMLTDGANFRNVNYHLPGDSLGTINLSFMTNVVKASVGTLAEQAGVRHSTNIVSEITIFNTGINDLSALCEIRTASVPNGYEILLDDIACLEGNSVLSLYDLQGALLMERAVLQSEERIHISTASLPTGIYVLSFRNRSGLFRQKLQVF